MEKFDRVASDLRELIKPHIEKMYKHRMSLLHMEKEVETKVSTVDAEVESERKKVNDVADKRVSLEGICIICN